MFLLEKLWEKFGDEAVLPTIEALDRIMETPGDEPYSKTREHWEKYYRAFEKDFIPDKPVPAGPKKAAKVGRNDPCPCGSGKKHKKCCWGKGR